MATRQMHLEKSGGGMASRTACGRNILRTPMSTNWAGFMEEPTASRCVKCSNSKQAEVNARQVKKTTEADYNYLQAQLVAIEKATGAYLADQCIDRENVSDESSPDYWARMVVAAKEAAWDRAEDAGLDLSSCSALK